MVEERKHAFRVASERSEKGIEKNIENNKVEQTSFISLYVAWIQAVGCCVYAVHGKYQIQKKNKKNQNGRKVEKARKNAK